MRVAQGPGFDVVADVDGDTITLELGSGTCGVKVEGGHVQVTLPRPLWERMVQASTRNAAIERAGALSGAPLLSVSTIQQMVSAFYDLPVQQLLGGRRNRRVCEARQVAMYLARERTNASFPALAESFNRDHSTVQHGVRRIGERRAKDVDLAWRVQQLIAMLDEAAGFSRKVAG